MLCKIIKSFHLKSFNAKLQFPRSRVKFHSSNVSHLSASLADQPSRFALHAPLSSSVPSHISTHCLLCVVSSFSERCYETIHLRYYDTGESWGRIHLRNVEQCTCEAGEIKCERVRYTSKICFQLLLFCFNLVLFLLCGPLLLG